MVIGRAASFRLAILVAGALAAASRPAANAEPFTPRTVAALPPSASAGHGAQVPFAEYEAENASVAGTVIGPDRRFTTIAAEASGRRAVRLARPGDHVDFTLAEPANAVTVRAAVPDSADGHGEDGFLDLSIDGRPAGRLPVTSRYGWYYGRYPFTNDPADGNPHHFFDETRRMFGRTLPAGSRVRLSVPRNGASAWYVVDLADFELVPPPARPPAGAVSVVAMGADPRGVRSSRAAFERAIAAARARRAPVWIPPGTFRIDGHLIVDHVAIAGAGPWYSIVHGDRLGFYGRPAPHGSENVRLEGFAIVGEVTERVDNDQVNGIGGAMSDSLLRNLFIHHVKVGMWFDGPMHDIRIEGVRITDTMADGINFHRGVARATVANTFIRNTGDDGLAAWSETLPDHDIVFRNDTVIAPILANGIAIYGGRTMRVTGNLVADTLTEGGGLHVGNRFKAVPVSGTVELGDNVVVRSGSLDPHWHFGVGALWFYALDAPIAANIRADGDRLIDSSYDAVGFIGSRISGVTLDGLAVEGAGGPAISMRSPGEATLSGSRASGLGAPAIRRCDASFRLRDGGGNQGFDGQTGDCTPACSGEGTHPCGETSE